MVLVISQDKQNRIGCNLPGLSDRGFFDSYLVFAKQDWDIKEAFFITCDRMRQEEIRMRKVGKSRDAILKISEKKAEDISKQYEISIKKISRDRIL